MQKLWVILIAACLLGLSACSDTTLAPVFTGAYYQPNSKHYRVRRGDTMYSIAFAYGLDYRTLARMNGIQTPYTLEVGQILDVNQSGTRRVKNYSTKISWQKATTHQQHKRPAAHNVSTVPRRIETVYLGSVSHWCWPAKGQLIHTYNPAIGNKGIDISSSLNTPIYAAAAGIVVYASDGLSAYGNLIIIKHNNRFLSAYAHNRVMLVHEGQMVQMHQKIALMGRTGTNTTMLHFEIRLDGQPINPLKYLPH